MLLAFELLLVDEFLAGGQDLVLRLDVSRIRPDRLGLIAAFGARSTATKPAAGAQHLHARGKAFQIALLFVREVDRQCFEFHDAPACHAHSVGQRGGNQVQTTRIDRGRSLSLVAADIRLGLDQRASTAAGFHLHSRHVPPRRDSKYQLISI